MIELKTAKFLGVEFPVVDMPTEGGNRIIKTVFPGSDVQSIERQGKREKPYSITAVIPHEGYYELKSALLRALDSDEFGTLTHPTFGDIENAICARYAVSEKITELGRATVSMVFEVDTARELPIRADALAAQVAVESDSFNQQVLSDLADEYDVDPDNFADALDNLQNVVDGMNSVADYADPYIQNVAQFRQSISGFAGALGNLIQAPADLAGEIGSLFDEVANLVATPGRLLGAFKLLFDFGADDGDVAGATKRDTAGRIQRANNRDLIRATIRGISLGNAYLSAASVDSGIDSDAIGVNATEAPVDGVSNTYTTTEDLTRTQDDLEAQYLDLRESQKLSNEALEQLDRLRIGAQKTLDVVRVNTRSVITIETAEIPLSVLVYDLYGSTELVDTIAELNNIKQNAFVSGPLKVLSE